MISKCIQDFDIAQIAMSGQCFRMSCNAGETWEVKAYGKKLCVTKSGQSEYTFDCTEDEYKNIWYDYFDFGTDYSVYKEIITHSQDQYLMDAVKYGYGIRILRQDLWETVVSFIISQQNNITRIRSIIERLCRPFEGKFPSPTLLKDYSEDDFKALGLGYRAKYIADIVKAALDGTLDLNYLKTLPTQEALRYLQKFNGIGAKVTNCIALFSLHKIDAFPIDVWIKRIINDHYGGKFPLEKYAPFAGIVQQYMFFYERFRGKEARISDAMQ